MGGMRVCGSHPSLSLGKMFSTLTHFPLSLISNRSRPDIANADQSNVAESVGRVCQRNADQPGVQQWRIPHIDHHPGWSYLQYLSRIQHTSRKFLSWCWKSGEISLKGAACGFVLQNYPASIRYPWPIPDCCHCFGEFWISWPTEINWHMCTVSSTNMRFPNCPAVSKSNPLAICPSLEHELAAGCLTC